MKAVLARRYGPPDVLTLEEVDQPSPEDDQVLVRVHAAALNPSDWHRMEGKIPMIRPKEKPQSLGPRRSLLGDRYSSVRS